MSAEPAQPIVPTSVEAEVVVSAPVAVNGSSDQVVEALLPAASTLDALAEASSSALELVVPSNHVESAAAGSSSLEAQDSAAFDGPSSEIASASASLLALGSMTPQGTPKVDADVDMESKVEDELAGAGVEAEASGSAIAPEATSSAVAGSSRLGGALGRRTSSRSLAATAANTYLEHASDTDEDDDERSVSSVPRKRGRGPTGGSAQKASASGSKKASTSAQAAPQAVGTPLTMPQVRNLSLMKRLKLTRQPNRGPEWRTEHTLFPESYKDSLTTPEAKKFLKIFDFKTNTLIQRPSPSIENLEQALTVLHAASATPDDSPLYKAWIAAKYEGEVMLLAGALREQIMRHLTRMKKRGGVTTTKKEKKEAASQEIIDPDADAEGEEEDELISGDELEEEEREEEEKEDEAGPSKKARIEVEAEVEAPVAPAAPAPVEVEQVVSDPVAILDAPAEVGLVEAVPVEAAPVEAAPVEATSVEVVAVAVPVEQQ